MKGNIMAKNVGSLDRIVRIIIGVVLIAYAIPLGFPHTGWNWLAAWAKGQSAAAAQAAGAGSATRASR